MRTTINWDDTATAIYPGSVNPYGPEFYDLVWRGQRRNKRVELRAYIGGTSVLLILALAQHHPKLKKQLWKVKKLRNKIVMTMSMNGTLHLTDLNTFKYIQYITNEAKKSLLPLLTVEELALSENVVWTKI